jgi:hypothetical protein
VPSPHDAADALAVAICHLHAQGRRVDFSSKVKGKNQPGVLSWRQYRPAGLPRA